MGRERQFYPGTKQLAFSLLKIGIVGKVKNGWGRGEGKVVLEGCDEHLGSHSL